MDSQSPKTGVAVVGLGMASLPHARSLRDLTETVDVRGVFARDRDRREAFARTYGFPAASSIEAIADDPAVEAVLILTPPNARIELVETFAAAGKHILMEKPVERTTDAARRIVRICEDAGVTLGIVFQHRFRAGSIKLRELIEADALGAIAAVQIVVPWWRPQSYYDEPGRGTLERDGGGVLISQAIHTLDLALSLAGPVREVQAIAGTTALHRMETEDFVGAGLRFASGAFGVLSATTASFPGKAESLVFDCANASTRLEAGELTVSWRDGRVERFGDPSETGGGADPMAFPHGWHRALIGGFLDAIKKGHAPAISGRDALRVHGLIDALLLSSSEGRAITITEHTQ